MSENTTVGPDSKGGSVSLSAKKPDNHGTSAKNGAKDSQGWKTGGAPGSDVNPSTTGSPVNGC